MKLFPFYSLCILFICSCESKEKIKQIEQMTKMINETDSLNRIFEKNKLDSTAEYQLAANTCMLRLKSNYKPTKVDLVFGRKVDEFKKLQKLFKKKGNHKTIANEAMVISNSIREEKQALYNLKMDVESGHGDKNKYDEFITFEQGKVNTIKILLEQYLIKKNKYLPLFIKSVKELNDFMDKWEKENMQ
ncbi:MAG: hypothetical protein FJZ67_04575 [Bacteroidetes bacterium]|nr:hypothetical protein [Bacteroidota bacterium]